MSNTHSYYRPGVALSFGCDSAFDQHTYRLLQIAEVQAVLNSPVLQTTVAEIGRRCDRAACFRLLQQVQPILYQQNRGEDACPILRTHCS